MSEIDSDKTLKTKWIIVIGVIVIGVVAFTQLYDVVIVRKVGANVNNSAVERSGKKLESNVSAAIDIDVSELDVDIDNLEPEELVAVNSFLKFKKIKAEFIPTGVPEIYGQELDISFDEVQDAINKVQIFGPTYGAENAKITLKGADLERYKRIGESIACEYCCGVTTLTAPDGSAACGCAHSIMMRGLAAYLIKNHPDVSDEWILGELAKWKITYFPKQTLAAVLQQLEESGEPGIKQLLQEFPDFLPQMVGGC